MREVLFPVNVTAGFINVCCYSLINCRADVYYLSPEKFFFFFNLSDSGCFFFFLTSSELTVFLLFKRWNLELKSPKVNSDPSSHFQIEQLWEIHITCRFFSFLICKTGKIHFCHIWNTNLVPRPTFSKHYVSASTILIIFNCR